MMDQSETLQAADLASGLQTLANQLEGGQALAVSYPDVVEDSISSNHSTVSHLEASIRETIGPGNDINLITISKFWQRQVLAVILRTLSASCWAASRRESLAHIMVERRWLMIRARVGKIHMHHHYFTRNLSVIYLELLLQAM